MKKFILPLLLLLGLQQHGLSQARATLANDSISFEVANNGILWYDNTQGTSSYEYPKGSGKSPFYSSQMWMGGVDPGGYHHLAAQLYLQGGNDFFPGPLEKYTISTDSDIMSRWDTIWVIDYDVVNAFRQNFDDSDFNIGDPQWASIRGWPGYKNPLLPAFSNDFSANKNALDFAPFVDVDSNGIYEPNYGDYPKMKGWKMAWWMYNDNGGPKTQTNTPALGIEVAVSAYIYSQHTILDNQSFYHYSVKNRSPIDYNNFYIARMIDMDIGDGSDDYVGSDSVLSIGYMYNADSLDGLGQPGHYGASAPMAGLYFEGVTLEGNLLPIHSITYGINSNVPSIGTPDTSVEYYNIMKGLNRIGDPFTDNCPYNSNGSTTKFVFEHHRDSLLCTCTSPPGDFRVFMSSEPMTLLPSTGALEFTQVAVIRRQGYTCGEVDPWQEVYDTITSALNNPTLSIPYLDIRNKIIIYPNPTQATLTIISKEEIRLNDMQLKMSNVLGQEVEPKMLSTTRSQLEIDVSHLAPGIYLLELTDEEHRYVQKFVRE